MLRLAAPLFTLTLAVGLASCTDDPPRGGAATRLDYVAIGDSYTAAPGIGRPDEPLGCVRTEANYPHRVARELDLDLVDVSCSSASTKHVWKPQTFFDGDSVPPQIEAVDRGTDIVTVSMGGNDFGLFSRVTLGCTQLAQEDDTGSPCTDADAEAGKDALARRLDDVRDNLIEVLEGVRERAPEARILVVGVPQAFPDQGGCDELPIAVGDQDFARAVNTGIDDALEAAAEQTGADFIDVFSATKGHDVCSEDPWIAGAQVPAGRRGFSFHPYVEEQKQVARLIVDELR